MAIQVTFMSIDFDSHEEPVTKIFNKNEVTVGRKAGNDLVLDRPEVSSYHAKIIAKPNGQVGNDKLFVVDLGSSNGTYLERDPLKPDTEIPIHANQRLIIGAYLLKPRVVADTQEQVVSPMEEKLPETPVISGHSFTEISVTRTSKVETFPEEKLEAPKPAEKAASLGGRILSGRGSFLKRPAPEIRRPAEKAPEAVEPIAETSESAAPSATSESQIETLQSAASLAPLSDATTHTMAAIPAEFSESELFTLTVGEEEVHDLHFEAAQLFHVAVSVMHKGAPLAGVKVDAGVLGETETDAHGTFRLSNIVEGTGYSLALSKEGYLFEPGVFSGTIQSNLELSVNAVKLFKLTGRVVHHGQGLSGVFIDAGNLGACQTEADGTFLFQNIREGMSYSLRAVREKFSFTAPKFHGTLEHDTNLEIEATKLISVTGQVIHKGRPLAGVEIECINLGKTVTDENGRYMFENIPEGTECSFAARKEGFKFAQSKLH